MDDLARPELDMSRPRPGRLADWVFWLISAAAVITFIISLLVPSLLLENESLRAPSAVNMALGAIVGVAMIAIAIKRSEVSMAARVAVALPFAHLLVMAVVGTLWVVLGSKLENSRALVPLVDALPIGGIVAAVVAGTFLAALVIARRRRREVIHVAVMISLVQLLLLGLWLPLASHHSVSAFDFPRSWTDPARLFEDFHEPVKLAAFALVPPLVIAIGYAAIATRRARWLGVVNMIAMVAITVAILFGISLRAGASATSLTIYLNFVPWLLAVAFVAVSMIALMCGTFLVGAARQRRVIARDRRQFAGAIVGTDTVACVAVRSWLRGPELVVDGFEVETRAGAIPVPPGAILAVPLPLVTTALKTGEAVAVVNGGAKVSLGGFDRPADGAPFRASLAPTANGSVVVGLDPQPPSDGLAQLALVAWRPCVAYLLIFLAVALPALAGMSAR